MLGESLSHFCAKVVRRGVLKRLSFPHPEFLTDIINSWFHFACTTLYLSLSDRLSSPERLKPNIGTPTYSSLQPPTSKHDSVRAMSSKYGQSPCPYSSCVTSFCLSNDKKRWLNTSKKESSRSRRIRLRLSSLTSSSP